MKSLLTGVVMLMAAPAIAEIHEVEMYSRSENGSMIFEPQYLKIEPGDSVRFLPIQPGHNVQTIGSMTPEGAEKFRSKINEDYTVTFDVSGHYGIKCTPHYAMGMVMLIEVSDAEEIVLPDDLPGKARERFEAILGGLPQ
ncbi:pseudoazurin [Paracoccus alkanivorans]|uniref:Pseudoazurin n=1 Tax=Paracoccus alkanivorans TaxID=2116655 RepID=A0A3M0MHQ4_9RHOB|nr:pseudoazurin [Paracoccus alkanivorans]RMC37256.1 pseudoazurin [Paracoccus alkanivorans]